MRIPEQWNKVRGVRRGGSNLAALSIIFTVAPPCQLDPVYLCQQKN